ncbi:hypothetical protein HYD56_00905 [Mycoplasmopsis bovis]|nr:hypothetical protein [Mycoplasmopsis bovis]QQH66521.1 hypothetical protein HYD56_00905 [Mycoplasmopsis bovis]
MVLLSLIKEFIFISTKYKRLVRLQAKKKKFGERDFKVLNILVYALLRTLIHYWNNSCNIRVTCWTIELVRKARRENTHLLKS